MQAKQSEIQLALQGNSKVDTKAKKKKGKTALAPDEQSYMRISFENSEDCKFLVNLIVLTYCF